MQAPTSQLVRKRVEKERIERFRLQDRDRSGVIEGPELRRALEELGLWSDDASILAALERHDLDHSGGLDLWEFTTLVRGRTTGAAGGARRRGDAKAARARAQRSRATDLRQPRGRAAGERAVELGGLPVCQPPDAPGPRDVLEGGDSRVKRARPHRARAAPVDPCEGRCQRRAEVEVKELLRQDYIQPCAAAIRRAKFGAQNSARNFAAAILSDASPTARLQAHQPDARRWPPARAASGAVRVNDSVTAPWNVPSPPREGPRRRKGAPLPFESTVTLNHDDFPEDIPSGYFIGVAGGVKAHPPQRAWSSTCAARRPMPTAPASTPRPPARPRPASPAVPGYQVLGRR